MSYVLGYNQYGKAEVHVVRVFRDDPTAPHDLVDYNVSVALTGDFDEAHQTGDQAKVLTTDACKNTVNAFAKEAGDAVRQPESFALALANHFVDDVPQVETARINIEAFPWVRSHGNPHAFVKNGDYVRTVTVTRRGSAPATVVSGLKDLTVLKTTDSEFHGFYQEKYTTLQPTNDRVMATAIKSQWAHSSNDKDWGASFDAVFDAVTAAFAGAYSYALQHTIWEMGQAALDADATIAEIRMSCPNKHHFVLDLSSFDLENNNEVFHADDRPYGLIEATIKRTADVDASAAYDPGQAWSEAAAKVPADA
ncbi:factor-independent urate hydroxylase [Branchiibius sp. NY16-3462-2]|uniref:factor-independent urate hydroxylase n=1 Tax=Branchiibius sp. NY16-3462-2 TaxID=1807500 RepID=UPI0007960932|nr:urate oxidase [Branchiibius sp. NY16-3462-2]KYH44924.1 urate oxidase [Branchiibius sp. NY16-3462-2]